MIFVLASIPFELPFEFIPFIPFELPGKNRVRKKIISKKIQKKFKKYSKTKNTQKIPLNPKNLKNHTFKNSHILNDTTRPYYLHVRKKIKKKKISCGLWLGHYMGFSEKAEKSRKNRLCAVAEGSNFVFIKIK
jgi:hypothetical protein